MNSSRSADRRCRGVTRRSFLADTGMGFTGLALSAMLARSQQPAAHEAWAPPSGPPDFQPKAKSVIWIFLCGGLSHVESFDVKPALNTYAGKSIDETPFSGVLKNAQKDIVGGNPNHGNRKVIMPLQTGWKQYGQSGLVVSDWFPEIGTCADDLAVVRSLYTNDNDHGAQLTWHTGRHVREGGLPTIGSWACYGLGTMNASLPEYVVLGTPTGDCCGGAWTHGAGYLGPEHAGVRLNVDPARPLPFLSAGPDGPSREEQLAGLSLLGKLNTLSGIDYPDDKDLRARLSSYELAYQMQSAVPETVELDKESEATRKMYGMDQPHCADFAKLCLTARRLVERGVRFVQIFHGGGGGGAWDAHSGIKDNHTSLAAQVDQPIAGLLKDLKQRGLFSDTTVVCGTEFGRTPGAENTGRDHHPQGFCAWLAGAGIKGGITHGETDEIGFHAVRDRHYVTDIHATVLRLLGLNSHRLEVPGRRRLEIDHGDAIREIIA
jgi:hypothetical protein